MSDIPNIKMNTSNMSDTEILDLFEQSFNDQISGPNNFDDPEFEIERLVGSDVVRVFVNLYGMAGNPTADTYDDVESVQSVLIQRPDKGSLSFNYVSEETRTLGGNEYQVVYESD